MSSLQKLLRGSSIVFVGLAVGKGGSLLSRLLVARVFGDRVFGEITVGITVVTLVSTFALIGLDTGVSRTIPQSGSDSDATISTGLKITLTLSVVASAVTYTASGTLAREFFSDPQLSGVVETFSLAVPSVVSMKYSVGVIRGMKQTLPKVLIRDLGLPVFRLLFLGVVVSTWGAQLGLDAVWAFATAYVAVSVFGLWYVLRSVDLSKVLSTNVQTSLVRFSAPLMITAGLGFLFEDLDVLFVGRVLSTESVGHYSAAYTIAMTMTLAIHALGFLFIPILSDLYSDDKISEARDLYSRSTTVNYALVTPLFLLIMVFPERTLRLLFDGSYTVASESLVVLAVGFYFHTLVGLNRGALVSFGRSKLTMYGMLFGVVINVVANFWLVPLFGIVGAAIATTASYVCLNVFYSGYLLHRYQVRPFAPKIALIAPIPLGIGLAATTLTNGWIAFAATALSVAVHLVVSVYAFDVEGLVREATSG